VEVQVLVARVFDMVIVYQDSPAYHERTVEFGVDAVDHKLEVLDPGFQVFVRFYQLAENPRQPVLAHSCGLSDPETGVILISL
jgi:hypothetical protein